MEISITLPENQARELLAHPTDNYKVLHTETLAQCTTLTLELPDVQEGIVSLLYSQTRYFHEWAEKREQFGFQRGQEHQYSLKTEFEQFAAMLATIRIYELAEYAKENEFIIHDLLRDIPGILRSLDALLQKAKNVQPFEGIIKPYKIETGEELIFFFERKLDRKNNRLLVGRNENGLLISLDYAWLHNSTWLEGKQYVIKNLGLHPGRRKKDPSYYAFDIKTAEEVENQLSTLTNETDAE